MVLFVRWICTVCHQHGSNRRGRRTGVQGARRRRVDRHRHHPLDPRRNQANLVAVDPRRRLPALRCDLWRFSILDLRELDDVCGTWYVHKIGGDHAHARVGRGRHRFVLLGLVDSVGLVVTRGGHGGRPASLKRIGRLGASKI